MDSRRAQTIVNLYGAVMERTADLGLVLAPESMLPFSKELIEEAIRLLLSHLPGSDESTRNALEVGYITLATFVPDEDAKLAADVQAAFNSGDLNHEGWKYTERFQRILNETRREEETLMKELQNIRGEQ